MSLAAALLPAARCLGSMTSLLLRAVRPLKSVRIGALKHDRIGHLSANTEIFLRRRALGKEDPRTSYLFLSSPPANRQLLRMIRRRVPVLSFPHAFGLWTRGLKPFLGRTEFEIDLFRHSYEYDEFQRAGPQLSFTPEEEERGKTLLRGLGVPDGAPFACFHSRDSAYLQSSQPGNDWSYHDYRDCSIDNYLPAARALAARGLTMVRMGRCVGRPLGNEPGIVDYAATAPDDFADIYLLARCKFLLGSTAGLSCVPLCFDVPVAMANLVPIGRPLWHPHDLFIPKRVRERASGRFLPVRELVSTGVFDWTSGKKYDAAGLETVENSAEEVAELAEEINARIDGSWTSAPEDEELQRRFWAELPASHPVSRSPSRVGSGFLRRHRREFL